MKRFIKGLISLSLLVFVVFGLVACGTPLSKTTASDEKSIINGVSTNGGTTAIYGDYLYFINGTKTNDGTSCRNITQGAICKIKYDKTAGAIVEDATAEVVVSDLVGYEDGSINIFGDFLYYTTPCDSKNYQGNVLNYKTEFKRYDLVNGTVQTIYTTQTNDDCESVEFEYYVVGEELYLLIYESCSDETGAGCLTSVKIGDNSQVVYQISDIVRCVMSENNGKSINADIVDANNFVFYSKAPSIEIDGYEEGEKVYKISPNKGISELISDNSHRLVTILSIKNGKLIYSYKIEEINKTFIYAQSIGTNSKLTFVSDDIISRKAYTESKDQKLFDEQSNGDVSIVAYNSTAYEIVYIQKEDGSIVPHRILGGFGSSDTVEFVSLANVSEVETNGEGVVTTTHEVEYLLYTVTASSKVTLYKIEIKRDGVVATSPKHEVVIDSDEMTASNGLIVPEVIGNNLFIMTIDEDDNIYLNMIDISKEIGEDNELIEISKK